MAKFNLHRSVAALKSFLRGLDKAKKEVAERENRVAEINGFLQMEVADKTFFEEQEMKAELIVEEALAEAEQKIEEEEYRVNQIRRRERLIQLAKRLGNLEDAFGYRSKYAKEVYQQIVDEEHEMVAKIVSRNGNRKSAFIKEIKQGKFDPIED